MLCTGASPQRCVGVSMTSARAVWAETYLVVEATGAVEVLEELRVRFVAPEVHARDFEVAPDCVCIVNMSSAARGSGKVRTVTEVIRVTAVVGHVPHRVVGRDVLRVFLCEICMQRK